MGTVDRYTMFAVGSVESSDCNHVANHVDIATSTLPENNTMVNFTTEDDDENHTVVSSTEDNDENHTVVSSTEDDDENHTVVSLTTMDDDEYLSAVSFTTEYDDENHTAAAPQDAEELQQTVSCDESSTVAVAVGVNETHTPDEPGEDTSANIRKKKMSKYIHRNTS